VIAAVQDLVKYTTKGHSKALKTGQVGFFQFAPWEVADYLKGVKNWHLHQSSRGWIAAQHAYEQEIAGIDSQAERDDGARRVSFVELVKDLEDAVAGELDDQAREEVIKTGVAILELHKKEREEDGEFSREQYDAIASHVAFLLGDDRSRPVNFTLTLPEQRELNRLRGRVSGPGVDVDVLLLAVRDRRRELAEISREVQALADGEQYSPAGQRLLVRQLRAEGRLKLAQDAVREAEERKRREIQVDAWVSEQRERAARARVVFGRDRGAVMRVTVPEDRERVPVAEIWMEDVVVREPFSGLEVRKRFCARVRGVKASVAVDQWTEALYTLLSAIDLQQGAHVAEQALMAARRRLQEDAKEEKEARDALSIPRKPK